MCTHFITQIHCVWDKRLFRHFKVQKSWSMSTTKTNSLTEVSLFQSILWTRGEGLSGKKWTISKYFCSRSWGFQDKGFILQLGLSSILLFSITFYFGCVNNHLDILSTWSLFLTSLIKSRVPRTKQSKTLYDIEHLVRRQEQTIKYPISLSHFPPFSLVFSDIASSSLLF